MTKEAEITNITRVSPDIRQYTVRLAEGKFSGEPGQHILIKKGTGKVKPYTPLTISEKTVTLMIRNYGGNGVSQYMSERDVGDTIEVKPDMNGNLYLRMANRPIALISTGAGITPMMAILHEYVLRGGEDCLFTLGEKNTDQLLYKALLEQYEGMYNVESEYVLSRESWGGREGYVQEHLDDLIDPNEKRDYYICGVPQMVVQTKEVLRDLGVDSGRIYSEGWEDNAVSD